MLSYFRTGSRGCHPKKVAGTQPRKNAEIEQKIAEIFHQNNGNYGYRRITLVLRRIWTINHKKVQTIMPKWVTDVTEFKCTEGKRYLSPIKDLFNEEIIAYDLLKTPNFEQITRMMAQAVAKLNGGKPILHSDQGWQYQMSGFRAMCQRNGIEQSMSRKGNCLDNGAMESFFGRLKTECYFGKWFETLAELEQTIHDYIHYYNNERIQVKLKGLSPVEYRTQSLN